jgi:hypothetical protein
MLVTGLLLLLLLLLLEGHRMRLWHLARTSSLEPAHLVTAAAAAAVNAASLGDHNSSQSDPALTNTFQPRVFKVAGGCHLSC